MISLNELVIVKRNEEWVNGTVKGISADTTRVLVQLVDTKETHSYPLSEVFRMGA